MIQTYLVTETVHRRKTGSSLRTSTYEERTIKTRWEPKSRLVTTPAGQEVASDTTVFSVAKVSVGDTLRDPVDGTDWPVIGVMFVTDLSNSNQFYESYL